MRNKILLFVSLLFIMTIGYSRPISEPSVHFSSPHVESVEHVNTFHETNVRESNIHPESVEYNKISLINERDFKTYPNGMYYYLILNNKTHKFDTIKASSKEEMKTKLNYISNKKNFVGIPAIISILSTIIVIVIIGVTSSNKNK